MRTEEVPVNDESEQQKTFKQGLLEDLDMISRMFTHGNAELTVRRAFGFVREAIRKNMDHMSFRFLLSDLQGVCEKYSFNSDEGFLADVKKKLHVYCEEYLPRFNYFKKPEAVSVQLSDEVINETPGMGI